jgi:hypothetical protein
MMDESLSEIIPTSLLRATIHKRMGKINRALVSSQQEDEMTIWEMLSQARDAALEIRRIEMETDERIGSIGVGARSYEAHGALGSVLDPMRKVDELIDWQSGQIDSSGLVGQIEDAAEIVSGIRASGDEMAAEIALRYFVRAEPMPKIAADVKGRSDATAEMDDAAAAAVMLKALEKSLCYWDEIGIARLREIGNQKSEIGNQNRKSKSEIRNRNQKSKSDGRQKWETTRGST